MRFALLDFAGGGIDGGPGNVVVPCHWVDSCLASPDNVLVARVMDGPAVGVGPAEVDRRV